MPMSKIITKILACIYGADNDDAVLECSLNFARAFNAQLIVATTEEGRRNSAEVINNRLGSETMNVEKTTLDDESIKTVVKLTESTNADLVVVSYSKHTQGLINLLEVPVLSILKGFKKGKYVKL